MSRNLGIGSRDLSRAGIMLLRNSGASFSTVSTNSSRWRDFAEWARGCGINRMEQIKVSDLVEYGRDLAKQVQGGLLGLPTAHNRVSAVNRILQLARGDKKVWVSAVRDCGLARRTGIAKVNLALSDDAHKTLCNLTELRVATLRKLLRLFGLRFKEGSLLNGKSALKAAKKHNRISISDGSKGGKTRDIPITSPVQLVILQDAAQLQDGRSMIPREMSYAQFRRRCYRLSGQFHRERHSYAHVRYQVLVGAPCPIAAGKAHGKDHFRFLAEVLNITFEKARAIDRAARLQVAKELGHERQEITNAYYG